MKDVLHKVISFFKRIFLFFRLHVHVEAEIRGSGKDKNDENSREE